METELIRNYVDSLDANGYFNGAIAVRHKGKTIFCKGYGMADYGFGVHNTSNTRFKIGSLSKAFTAMAILPLEKQGVLRREEPISRFFSDFPGGDQITVHHLLSHMSGVADFASHPDYWTRMMRLPATMQTLMEAIKELPPEFGPGSHAGYSNSGYTILAAIIEKVTGLSYGEYMDENVFKPLGMENTGTDDGRKVISQYAQGYTLDRDIRRAEWIDMTVATGAYSIYSTAEDLLRWDRALDGESIFGREPFVKMFARHNELCGYDWFFTDEEIDGISRTSWEHFGDVNGFASYYLRYPEEELSVIVLSNFGLTPVDRIAKDVASIVFEQKDYVLDSPASIVPDERLIAAITGTYSSEKGQLNIFSEGDRVFAALPKMYGVVYNCEIIPVAADCGQVSFKGKHLNDELIIDLQQQSMTHTDPYGTRIRYLKKATNLEEDL
ncbi:serine hydrolase domain-containing protein [Bhargavaea massiliensis]|uniref:serine hydrolase domain-containing protein n=1 Tax=Bhargavaea massiliensis TaxID=2697500 RepID=UPI001BCB670C|nr:serine hydrolase domain-containing protein [Bhargavaea massiliensis]